MRRYDRADQVFRDYFESYGRLASPPGLSLSGMPHNDSSSLQGHLQAKHADLTLAMRGLEPQQFAVVALKFAAACGVRSYLRYVSSSVDVRSHETFTGKVHPDDDSLLEVTGVLTVGASRQQTANILGLTVYKVDQQLAVARNKVDEWIKRTGAAE